MEVFMPTESIVTARLVLQSQHELQRLGHRRVLALLESREPDLTEFLLEATVTHYHHILDTGATPKRARQLYHSAEAIALTCILAIRKAHEALWQTETGNQLESQLEPPTPPDLPQA